MLQSPFSSNLLGETPFRGGVKVSSIWLQTSRILLFPLLSVLASLRDNRTSVFKILVFKACNGMSECTKSLMALEYFMRGRGLPVSNGVGLFIEIIHPPELIKVVILNTKSPQGHTLVSPEKMIWWV